MMFFFPKIFLLQFHYYLILQFTYILIDNFKICVFFCSIPQNQPTGVEENDSCSYWPKTKSRARKKKPEFKKVFSRLA